MRRKNKNKYCMQDAKTQTDKKDIYDILGVSGEILANEPKIIITGDYLIEIFNHKGILDFSDTVISVNTKKSIYKISGINLTIRSVTDDELTIHGMMISVEKIN